MREECQRPRPEAYQPRISVWGHVWRTTIVLGISLLVWVPAAENQAARPPLLVLELTAGLLSFVLVFFRRRWPLGVAVATALLSPFSALATGPSVLAAVSLATRRNWVHIVLVAVLSTITAQLLYVVQPVPVSDPLWLSVSATVISIAAVMAWGMYIGSRRELLYTLRNRAESAEAEQERRMAQARATERARIAREMHDVLAHRISQVSMHAGALAFREDLTPEQVRSSASVIREKAHEALTDLRGVLGVLRDGEGELTLAPQPTYADLGDLVEEAREGGHNVELRLEVDVPDDVPLAAGRTLYRIVQEGITNARKHAPASLLTVLVSGSPEDGLDVVLRNPLGFGSATPGAGLGLIGLSERAELRGGRLETRREGSTFVLHGWIPWAA